MPDETDQYEVPQPPKFDRQVVDEWLEAFPELSKLDDAVWNDVLDSARPVEIPAGTVVFRDGDGCQNYLIVVQGSVRVQKMAENGREIVLYRVHSGEACILTTSCLLSSQRYPAEGVTETDVRAISIPVPLFDAGITGSRGFRHFVFSSYGKRISELIMLVEDVAFGKMDIRLSQYLLDRAEQDEVIRTHQEMAADLGTAREVVSRQLKEFERRGWVELSRGKISLVKRASLERHVSGHL